MLPPRQSRGSPARFSDGYLQRGGGLGALRENPPPVAGCSVCGAVWRTIFSGLAAKEDLTVGLGYRPTTIADLKFSKLKVIGHGRNSSRNELRGEVFSRRGANFGLEISSSGAICVHLILCKIAVAIANPSGDRMVKLLRFHGSRTELEGITAPDLVFSPNQGLPPGGGASGTHRAGAGRPRECQRSLVAVKSSI